MKDRAPLLKEGYSLVLDMYLGGVSGAIVKNGIILHVSHNKISFASKIELHNLIAQTENFLYKTLDDLVSKKKISKTYIFIDAPLSYAESHEVLFQNKDVTFFEQNIKEIEGTLDLPDLYKEILGSHVADGVVIEHPPKNHTLNGYSTSNLSLSGERKAQITQQWIQRHVYTALQKAKQMYSLGTQVFLPSLMRKKNDVDVLMLGEVVSTYYHKDEKVLLNTGVGLAILKSAQENTQSFLHVQSMLQGIERNHGTKNPLYQNMVKSFASTFSKSLKKDVLLSTTSCPIVFVGDNSMLPVVQDALASEKNMYFTEIYKGTDARLAYIVKNKVQ